MMEVRSRSGRDQRWVSLGGKERVTEVGRRGVWNAVMVTSRVGSGEVGIGLSRIFVALLDILYKTVVCVGPLRGKCWI